MEFIKAFMIREWNFMAFLLTMVVGAAVLTKIFTNVSETTKPSIKSYKFVIRFQEFRRRMEELIVTDVTEMNYDPVDESFDLTGINENNENIVVDKMDVACLTPDTPDLSYSFSTDGPFELMQVFEELYPGTEFALVTLNENGFIVGFEPYLDYEKNDSE
jgi:hypothetical protein